MQGVGQHGKQNLLIREFNNAENPSQALVWVRIKSFVSSETDNTHSVQPRRFSKVVWPSALSQFSINILIDTPLIFLFNENQKSQIKKQFFPFPRFS